MLNTSDDHWTDHSICRGADPDLFYPINYARPVMARQVEAAKAICAHCPVQADCLDWALRAGEPEGIWGGTTPEERRHLRRRPVGGRTRTAA
ncbi:WhiB family transcriptional regulator [Thermomonospora umbrina]|uniref:Transcriptional regulator WhiB n=1 Tax=Thermomonospora umbrina TaxID=111806 RepID=A0A3D9SSP2_9ACTN|nr:WhiB family transcriptional regulator [Thermomonospora umbrina]REE97003.1 WhiB family redox-sensing transcriptional regulator [Thermomonospora umbrina]